MRCRRPGCSGMIADGYCDICGMPPLEGSSPANQTAKPAAVAGPCRQPGCKGRLVDGYCDVCGSPPQASLAATEEALPSGLTKASVSLGSIAFGSNRATSFGSKTERRKKKSKVSSRMGAGLTYVSPAPLIDPAKAILKNPVIPEKRRICPKCQANVGQSTKETEGRMEGFCPKCGSPYSFSVKLKPGDLVSGQYEVTGAIAHGGMGWIYLARDKNVSGRWVVLKGLLNTSDADALASAISERQFLAQVGAHPQIVEIYNFVTHEDAGYIVMEYVGGRSLKQLMQQRMTANNGVYDPLPADQALAFLIEILPALGYMHDIDLLYCDFKPDNVIQTEDTLKLIDLGGVRHANDDESAIFGTVGYQAPEVATLGAGVASDIYTVGRTLLVLCADVPGFQNEWEFSIPPAEQLPVFAANDSLYRLLLRCCAINPDDRFTSINELRGQMMGVLREVVAAKKGSPANTSSESAFFLTPQGIGNKPSWQNLPSLHPDEDDPALGWISQLPPDPRARLLALQKATQKTPEVSLELARSALLDEALKLADETVQRMLTEDPWEWRAVWVAGLCALRTKRFSDAQACFNAVYGQLPGELAPKLALALACELGNQPEFAARLYQVCLETDATYVTVAAFGLARLSAVERDLAGIFKALQLVPSTSRGYPDALWMRAHYLVTMNDGSLPTDTIWREIDSAPLEARTKAAYRAQLLWRALNQQISPTINGKLMTRKLLRQELERTLRSQAGLANDPNEKAWYVDQANKLRPWSLL